MNLFETVKDTVTTRQAAERYGLRVGRSGMCKCPFHDDKNPSMKVDKRFHCFGCQADGDVIDFTSRLFNLSTKDAALKLADDFGITYDPFQPDPQARRRYEIGESEIFAHKASFVYMELADYRNLLLHWMQQYAPTSPDEAFDPRFLEAVNNLALVEYQLDVLLSDNTAAKREIVSDYLREHKKEYRDMESIRKVEYYETDMMGVTHHANYIHWMEEARIDFMDQLGFPYTRMEREGVMSPVKSLSVDYKHTSTFGDEISIQVSVESFNGVVMVILYDMRNQNGEQVCTARSEHVFLNREGRFVRMKRDLPEFCAAIEATVMNK